MKPIDRPNFVVAYMLLKLNSYGKLEIESTNITEQGDLGIGFYSDLIKVQYQQTVLALKGIKTEIYPIEYPL